MLVKNLHCKHAKGAIHVNVTAADVQQEHKGLHQVALCCRACGAGLHTLIIDHYSVCTDCKSANYVSLKSAEDDNVRYFDRVYADVMRQPIDKRHRMFERYEKVHSWMHARERDVFSAVLGRISNRIMAADSAVEVGFGQGQELANWLRAGADMYGLDVSQEAVAAFQSRYPEFSGRVSQGYTIPAPVDVVYSNALFEHLDEPGLFLQEAFSCLSPKGALIMRLPVITADQYCHGQMQQDINFWKPCHRVLYTYQGLELLLRSHGFQIVDSAPLAYYGYKVMSTMLRYGYADIAMVRNPYYAVQGLESDTRYALILIESLFRKVICSDYAVIAQKPS